MKTCSSFLSSKNALEKSRHQVKNRIFVRLYRKVPFYMVIFQVISI